MSEVIKKTEFEMPEGKAEAKVVAQFEDTIEGDDGHLHAVGRDMPDGKANAEIKKQFANTVDEGAYLRAESAPGK